MSDETEIYFSMNINQSAFNLRINATQTICEQVLSQSLIKTKVGLVVVVGTTVAFVSVGENILVLWVIWKKASFRNSHLFYLMILAALDILICLSYIAIFPIEVLMHYHQSSQLSWLFHSYVIPLFTLSQVALTSSTYLILVASVERYCTTTSRVRYTGRIRGLSAFFGLSFAAIVKGTVFVEAIVSDYNCSNQFSYQLAYSNVSREYWYNTVWMFWLRHFLTVFIPFLLITSLNAALVSALRRTRMTLQEAMIQASLGRRLAKASRDTLRAATRMLLMVVATYLMANSLNVVIAVWEHWDFQDLSRNHGFFYALVTDVISLLTVIATASRLPIYFWCHKQFRRELLLKLQKKWLLCKPRPPPQRKYGMVEFEIRRGSRSLRYLALEITAIGTSHSNNNFNV